MAKSRDLGPALVKGFHRVWVPEGLYHQLLRHMPTAKARVSVRTKLAGAKVGVRSTKKRTDISVVPWKKGQPEFSILADRIRVKAMALDGRTYTMSVANPLSSGSTSSGSCGLTLLAYEGGPDQEIALAYSCEGACTGGRACKPEYAQIPVGAIQYGVTTRCSCQA